MKKYFLLKILFLLVSLMLLGCGETEVMEESVIRINVGPEPKTMDPSLNSAMDVSVYIGHAFEGLSAKDKEGKITYGVADNWDISDDGLTYTFYIRDNAKWSDGKAVTAHDFVYTWQRIVNPLTASEYAYQLSPIKNAVSITAGDMPVESLGVIATDDNTLVVTLEAPTAYFLELTADATFFPVRRDIIEANGDKWTLTPETYIGNGPFKMTERSIDDKIVMEQNEYYWNLDSLVANKLVFVLMQNENAAVAGIKEGSLHFAEDPPAQDIPVLVKEGLLQIRPYLGTYYYSLNVTNEILKDPRVRKALSLVIDRNYLVEQVSQGGEIPAGGLVPSSISDVEGDFRENGGDYYSLDPADYNANVSEAKQLMADAGYPDGEGFPVLEFKTNPSSLHTSMFEAIQQMWSEHLGIDSIMSQEEWAVFQQTRNDKNFVIARHGWIGDYADPMAFVNLFITDSPQNNGGYSSAKFDELVEIAKASGDQNVRMKAMHDAEAVLLEDMGIIPIYFYTLPLLVNPKLKGVVFDPLGMHKFNYAFMEE